MKKNKKLILVSGTGRNSGKTTLICKIISQLKNTHDVYALKITTHQHGTNKHMPDFRGDGYAIWIEHAAPKGKDTWRMIQAGARLVFYIECQPDKMQEAYEIVIGYLPENSFIVCESGGLRQNVFPALFIMANNEQLPKASSEALLSYADEVFTLNKILLFTEKDIERILGRYLQL